MASIRADNAIDKRSALLCTFHIALLHREEDVILRGELINSFGVCSAAPCPIRLFSPDLTPGTRGNAPERVRPTEGEVLRVPSQRTSTLGRKCHGTEVKK